MKVKVVPASGDGRSGIENVSEDSRGAHDGRQLVLVSVELENLPGYVVDVRRKLTVGWLKKQL